MIQEEEDSMEILMLVIWNKLELNMRRQVKLFWKVFFSTLVSFSWLYQSFVFPLYYSPAKECAGWHNNNNETVLITGYLVPFYTYHQLQIIWLQCWDHPLCAISWVNLDKLLERDEGAMHGILRPRPTLTLQMCGVPWIESDATGSNEGYRLGNSLKSMLMRAMVWWI